MYGPKIVGLMKLIIDIDFDKKNLIISTKQWFNFSKQNIWFFKMVNRIVQDYMLTKEKIIMGFFQNLTMEICVFFSNKNIMCI